MALLLTVTEPREPVPGLQNSMVFGPSGGCIGRGQDNDWVLPDPQRYLSVHHARVRCHQGAWFVEDTSTNGVFLNSGPRPLGRNASPPLRHGDRLRMGGYELRVSLAGPSAESDSQPGLAALSGERVEELLIDHSSRVPQLPEPAAEAQPFPAPLADRRQVSRATPGITPEFDAFCRGAGMPASDLPANARLAALQLAGLMLREALVGARELARARRETLLAAGLAPEQDETDFLALQRCSIEELLQQFLTGADPALPEPIPWLRAVFEAARAARDLRPR